ncbi:ribonuclease PH [Bacillus cereus]|nr:ribonuclease PH [Bacillus cereus]TKI00049.1 ribonuclease PH [Bacillus cereus]
MIIINYYSTLIDKDYHCQYETHIFSYKKQKARQKDFFFSLRSS